MTPKPVLSGLSHVISGEKKHNYDINMPSEYPDDHHHHHQRHHGEDHASHMIPFLSDPQQSDRHNFNTFAKSLHDLIVPVVTGLQQIVDPSQENGYDHAAPRTEQRNIIASMDIHQFTPEEMSVIMNGNEVVIEGKHEERYDGFGFISRRVTRRIHIPSEMHSTDVKCDISSDGILEISTPRNDVEVGEEKNVSRMIPIHYNARLEITNPTVTDNMGRYKYIQWLEKNNI